MNDKRIWPRLRQRRFLKDRRGVTAIEFAMLAPAFLATLLAGFETSLDYYQTFELDQAAQYAMRQIQVGNAPAGASSLKSLFCGQLPSTMTCARVVLDVRVVTDFNSVPWLISNPTGGTKYAPGQPGDTVLLQSAYAAPVISPIWFSSTTNFNVGGSTQKVRFISVNAVARNEK